MAQVPMQSCHGGHRCLSEDSVDAIGVTTMVARAGVMLVARGVAVGMVSERLQHGGVRCGRRVTIQPAATATGCTDCLLASFWHPCLTDCCLYTHN